MMRAIIRFTFLVAVVVTARRDEGDGNVRRDADTRKKKGRQWRLSGGFEYHPGDPVAVVANKVIYATVTMPMSV